MLACQSVLLVVCNLVIVSCVALLMVGPFIVNLILFLKVFIYI